MARILHVLIPAVVAAGLTQATPAIAADEFIQPEPAKGFSYPEVFCTNRGVRVEVEEYSCLNVGGKEFLAKCDISLNNPMWRPTGDTCDSSTTSDVLPVSSDESGSVN